MKVNSHKSKSIATGYLFFTVTILAIVTLANKVLANEIEQTSSIKAVSVGQPANKYNNIDKAEKFKVLRQSMLTKAAIKGDNFASGKARESKLAKKGKSSKASLHDFQIFQAQSYLIKDRDHDGYFHEFTITFDADVHAYSAKVYAEMYLSIDGGPWHHYYTTDVFTIYGDDPDDEYEVFTRLIDGFPADNYNVMIDLYEYGYDDVVASFSDYDSSELYGLPLESLYYEDDYGYPVSESHGHGGSMGFVAIIIASMFGFWRKLAPIN